MPRDLGVELWIQRLKAVENERALRLKRAWNAYYGRFRKPLKVEEGEYDDNLRVNYARLIVDVSAGFLFGSEMPRFELEEGKVTEPEAWLEECWRYNHQASFLAAVAVNGAVCGHTFVKIVPGEEGEHPRLVNVSPEYVSVFTDPDDLADVWLYLIEYTDRDKEGQEITIRQLIERDDSGAWQIRDEISQGTGSTFQVTHQEVWPYEWPPIVDCQNLPHPNEYYGLADLESSVVELNEGINFVVSNISRMIRQYGHPVLWAKNMEAANVQITSDDIYCLPHPDAELHALEAHGHEDESRSG